MKIHIKQVHPKKFKSIKEVEDHKKIHVEKNPWKGQQCSYTTKCGVSYKSHFNAVYALLRPYECDLCDQKCAEKENLRTHMRKFHPDGKLCCDLKCWQKFETYEKLVEHRRFHIGVGKWQCYVALLF